MRHLLLCVALAWPGAPALAGVDRDGGDWFDRTASVAPHALHREHLYQGDGIWTPRVFSRDDGFFQGRGAGVRVVNGRPVYDYDRDYLFDFPRGARHSEKLGFVSDEMLAEPEECRTVRVPDGRSGSAEVRVCS